MEPISGPFLTVHAGNTAEPYNLRRVWSRQKPPYNRALPFEFSYCHGPTRTIFQSSWGESYDTKGFNGSFNPAAEPEAARYMATAYSKAYEDVVAKLKDQQGWGEALAQYKATRATLVTTMETAAASALAVKRGNFKAALHLLGFTRPTRRMSEAKKRAGDWLAWTYAISPTIADAQAAVKTLVLTDFGWRRLRGSATNHLSDAVSSYESTGGGFNKWYSGGRVYRNLHFSYRVQVDCRISNPNTFLATTSGFATATLPLDLVPFSFVADWFGNFGAVVGSLSAFAGVTVENSFHTYMVRGVKHTHSYSGAVSTQPGAEAFWRNDNTWNAVGVECKRELGLPSPSFVIYPFEGLSMRRALNAIALIVQVFGK